jgi:hypothetical protein
LMAGQRKGFAEGNSCYASNYTIKQPQQQMAAGKGLAYLSRPLRSGLNSICRVLAAFFALPVGLDPPGASELANVAIHDRHPMAD